MRVAHNVLNARVNHRLGALSAFAELKVSSDREDNNLAFNGRDVLPGYTLLNVGATWDVQKNVSILGRINNLSDERYMLANTYAMPGRNVYVSVNWAL